MSFRRYDGYSDSNIEGLGQVPSHWAAYALKRLCVIRYGIGEPPPYRESGTPLIRATNVDHGRVNPAGLVFVDPADIPEKRAVWLAPGDIIVVRSGAYTGDSAIIAPEHVPAIAGFDMVLRPTACAPKFLQYALLSSYLCDAQIGLEKLRAAQPHLNAEELGACNVILPPRPEQDAIVVFLDGETEKIDALVESQRRLIELLNEKRQATIAHAVTKGLDPSAPIKDSGVEWLGAVPAHWKVCRIANLFTESAALLTDDLPILSVSIHNGVSDEELDEDDLERKVSRSEDRGKYKRVRPGDLVYNMMRAWQGGFGTVSVDGGVSPAYVVARPKVDIETAFVEWVLRTPQCVEEMRTRSVGVTDFRLRLYWDEFRDLKIALPPLAEQRRILTEIGAEIERYRKLAEAAEAAVTLLSERRAALISAAVTGKIDVRGWTAADVRTAVAAEIVRLHARRPTFGRVKNQKLLYLAEAHAGITEIGGRYERKAAGPYDADLIALVERDLEAAGVMTVSQPEGTGSTVSYSLNRSWKPDNERLKAMLGGRLAAFEQVNAKLADLKTRDAEAVATLYAVWNDALIDGEACDDARVIRGFLDEWHPEKREKFKQAELHTWLGWMRRNGIVPSGRGPRTGTRGLFA